MEIDVRFFLNGPFLHPRHARPAPRLDAEADGEQARKGGEKLSEQPELSCLAGKDTLAVWI